MSAMRSSAASMPTENRTRSSGTGEPGPSDIRRCSARLSAPPSDVALWNRRSNRTTRAAARQPHGHDRSEATFHLARRDFVPRRVGQSRIAHLRDGRMADEMLGDPLRIPGRRRDAQDEGPHAAQQQPALEGAEHRAAKARSRRHALQKSSSSAVTSAPASTSECPLSCLVAECITRSAPCSRGRVSTGVGTVLSTAKRAPASCAICAAARRSVMTPPGLAGVSVETMRVSPEPPPRPAWRVSRRHASPASWRSAEISAPEPEWRLNDCSRDCTLIH